LVLALLALAGHKAMMDRIRSLAQLPQMVAVVAVAKTLQ
jgi:hypothetical protein